MRPPPKLGGLVILMINWCRLKFETVFSYCCVMSDVSEEEGICNGIITSWEVGLTAGCCSKAVRALTHTFTSLPAL